MFPSFQVFHRMRFEAFFQFRLITRWQSVKLLLILVLENSQSHQPTSETLIKQQLFGNIRYHDAFALKEPWDIQHRSLKLYQFLGHVRR